MQIDWLLQLIFFRKRKFFPLTIAECEQVLAQ